MNADALLDALAELLAPRVASVMASRNPNELLSVPKIAKELRMRTTAVRLLITAGTLPRCPDIREMRVKRSEVEKYGTRK